MARSILFWFIALVVTLGSAYYQRTTGPTYPVDGTAALHGETIDYSLTRTHGGDGDQDVPIVAPSAAITGVVIWKRYKTSDAWTETPMIRKGDKLHGAIPHQPPAGKVEYRVELRSPSGVLQLPENGDTVVTRFKGAVPLWALLPHVVLMFLAMLTSTRAGIEALLSDGRPRPYAMWTLGLLTAGGMILGPVVQKFAFDAYWTGFPFGTDLTDNKTLVAYLGWIGAVMLVWDRGYYVRHAGRRWAVVAAALILLAVYLIPHSMFGSELDYSTLPAQAPAQVPAP